MLFRSHKKDHKESRDEGKKKKSLRENNSNNNLFKESSKDLSQKQFSGDQEIKLHKDDEELENISQINKQREKSIENDSLKNLNIQFFDQKRETAKFPTLVEKGSKDNFNANNNNDSFIVENENNEELVLNHKKTVTSQNISKDNYSQSYSETSNINHISGNYDSDDDGDYEESEDKGGDGNNDSEDQSEESKNSNIYITSVLET